MPIYSVSANNNESSAWKAFDNKTDTCWTATYDIDGSATLTFKFEMPVLIKGIRFTPTIDNPDSFPLNIAFWAGNTVDSTVHVETFHTTTPIGGVAQVLELNDLSKYSVYSFIFSGTHVTPTPAIIEVGISEIEFLVSKDIIPLPLPTPVLQEKSVSPQQDPQTVMPDADFDGLSKVNVSAAPLQTKTISPGSTEQTVTPDASYYGLSQVTVEAASLQSKSVTPTTSQQIITPDSNYYGLSRVTVAAAEPSGVDTNDATASASDIRSGKTAYVKGSKVSGSMSTVSVPTPSISVSSSGLITSSVTQSAGYTVGGDGSSTKQLTTKSSQTYTPTTSDQTISSGRYLTGVQTIKGDANLIADNIKAGVSIFGVTGTYADVPSPDITANVPLVNATFVMPSGTASSIMVVGSCGETNAAGNYHFAVYPSTEAKTFKVLDNGYVIVLVQIAGGTLTISGDKNWWYMANSTNGLVATSKAGSVTSFTSTDRVIAVKIDEDIVLTFKH